MKDFLGQDVRFFDLDRLYFGNKEKDVNFCDLSSHSYKIKDGIVPDLSKNDTNHITLYLESNTPHALRDIELNLAVLPFG